MNKQFDSCTIKSISNGRSFVNKLLWIHHEFYIKWLPLSKQFLIASSCSSHSLDILVAFFLLVIGCMQNSKHELSTSADLQHGRTSS